MKQVLGRTLRADNGAYQIYEVVATGGFASVFFGRDLGNNTPVAVKLLHPHHARNPRVLERFEHEAALVLGLTHPNIVRVLAQGRDDDVPFIVMEWVTGWTIADLIEQRGAFPAGEAAAVAGQVLQALEAARRRGVIHRDIKPPNLMVTPDKQVKVMDFGIAKDASLEAATGTGTLLGTPAYMAPEQFRGEPLDCRTDLYALGVTLYQMLAGRVPFEAPTTAGYMYQHLHTTPTPLASLRPGLPPRLAALVHRALAKAPADRFQTPSEMHAALLPFADTQVTLPETPPPPAPNERSRPRRQAPPDPTEPDGRLPPPPTPSKKPWMWGLIAGGLLVGLIIGYLEWPKTTEVTSTPTPTPPLPTTRPDIVCTHGLSEADEQAQRRAWPETIAKLEGLRAQGCDVVQPLYDAYLNQGIALAEDERTADATAIFDKALQVKDGSEARRERGLAVAYRAGREALERKAWPTAIEQLVQVHGGSPNYARGNVVLHLVNAYLGRGDELMAQDNPEDALPTFKRADTLKPGDPLITERIKRAEDAIARRTPTPTVPPSPTPSPTPIPPTATATPSTPAPPQAVINQYYQLVSSRQLQAAYELNSEARKRQILAMHGSLQGWSASMDNSGLVSISIRNLSISAQSATTATIVGTEEATYRDLSKNTSSATSISLVREGDPWKIDRIVTFEQIVRDYYQAIDQKRYGDAYARLSRTAQNQQSAEAFARQFSETLISITVRRVDGVNLGTTTVSLVAHTTTVSEVRSIRVTGCTAVDWRLVLEDGQWRRDNASQRDESC